MAAISGAVVLLQQGRTEGYFRRVSRMTQELKSMASFASD
jgi:hypothetical protein